MQDLLKEAIDNKIRLFLENTQIDESVSLEEELDEGIITTPYKAIKKIAHSFTTAGKIEKAQSKIDAMNKAAKDRQKLQAARTKLSSLKSKNKSKSSISKAITAPAKAISNVAHAVTSPVKNIAHSFTTAGKLGATQKKIDSINKATKDRVRLQQTRDKLADMRKKESERKSQARKDTVKKITSWL